MRCVFLLVPLTLGPTQIQIDQGVPRDVVAVPRAAAAPRAVRLVWRAQPPVCGPSRAPGWLPATASVASVRRDVSRPPGPRTGRLFRIQPTLYAVPPWFGVSH